MMTRTGPRRVQRPPIASLCAALGTCLVAALASCATASAYVVPSCGWNPSAPSVTAGQTLTITLTCVGDAADHYSLRVTDAAGLTAVVTPAGTPNAFTLTVTAPADARPGHQRVQLAIDGAMFPATASVPVTVERVPTPECFVEGKLTLPAGLGGGIYVRCQSSGRDGEAATLEIIDQPRHGTLGAPAYGPGWTYTPARGFIGADALTFRARNAFGVSPPLSVAITVRRPTKYEQDAEYLARVCSGSPSSKRLLRKRAQRRPTRVTKASRGPTSCRAGRGRRTSGGTGTGKVTHRHWPAITGVYYTFPGGGGGRLDGGERTDELLGHHSSDTIFGGAGSDIIWGDWDPANNNGNQRDNLNGGAGSDFIYTSHGRNRVTGGPGNDFIWAFYGHGTINCGPGIDKVRLSGRKSAYRLKSCERRGTF